MTAELPEVTQDITVNVADYVAGLELAINAAERFRDMNVEAVASADALSDSMVSAAATADVAAGRMNDLSDAAIRAALGSEGLDGALVDVRDSLAAASAASGGLSRSFDGLAARVTGVLVPALGFLDDELDKKVAALTATAGAAGALSGALTVNATRTAANAAATGAAANATGMWVFGLRLTANALHWIVMGSLEILSTAVPAMVAFSAGVAGMTPTFVNIGEHMQALSVAFGDLGSTANNTGTRIGGLVAHFNQLANAMAPDAYQVFGSVINDVSSKVGVFSKMAQQAANVIADFASKITTDLSGQAGQQLAGFFGNAVKYMTQWGQFLGNLGHTFLNVIGSMWGVGQLLLDVLVAISRALLAITSNRAVQFIIGLAAAFSALYRYSQLVVTIFTWLSGLPIVAWLIDVGGAALAAAAEFGVLAAAGTVLDAVLMTLVPLLMGPVGIALAVVAAGLGIWYLATHRSLTATQQFTASLDDLAAKASSLNVMNVLASNVGKLNDQLAKTPKYLTEASSASRFTGMSIQALNANYTVLTQSQQQQLQELGRVSAAAVELAQKYRITVPQALALAVLANVKLQDSLTKTGQITAQARQQISNFVTGIGLMNNKVGALGFNLDVMEAQTEAAASQIAKLNQAADAFVSAGESAFSSFVTYGQGLATLDKAASAAGASLTGISASSLTLQSDFQQQVTAVNAYADAMRLAQATTSQQRHAMADMVAPMIRMAAGAKGNTAQLRLLASEVGLTLPQLRGLAAHAGDTAARMRNLEGITQALGVSLNDLEQAASALNTTMDQAILSTFTKAQVSSSGLNGAIQVLDQNTSSYGDTLQGPMTSAGRAIITILEGLGLNAKQAAAEELVMADNALRLAGAIRNIPTSHTTTITTVYTSVGTPGGGYSPGGGAGGHHITGGVSGGPVAGLTGGGGPGGAGGVVRESPAAGWSTAHITGAAIAAPVVNVHMTLAGDLDDEALWTRLQTVTSNYGTMNSGKRTGSWVPG